MAEMVQRQATDLEHFAVFESWRQNLRNLQSDQIVKRSYSLLKSTVKPQKEEVL